MLQHYSMRVSTVLLVLAVVYSLLWTFSLVGILPVWLGMALGFGVALGLIFVTARSVSHRITTVAQTAEEMAGGDLDKMICVHQKDEVGKLANSLNLMAMRLRDTLAQVTEEKNRMQAVLDCMADGVIAVNAEGRVILVNPVAEDVFGISEKTSKGKTILEVVRNYDLDRLFRETLASGRAVKERLRILTPEPRIFRLHLTPLHSVEGGIVVLFRDITERGFLEQMRTEFVANASQELRTPLTSLQGFIKTLRDGALEDPVLAAKFLGGIEEEAGRLSRLVDELLELARAEGKRGLFESELTRVDKVVERVTGVLEPQIREKGLEVRLEIEPELMVSVDPGALYQVLLNLVDNAVRFTTKGWIRVHARKEAGGVRFEVEDSGIGIESQHLPRVFERFYRVEEARTLAPDGTGLGLAIVKHIVEGHGGRVGVSSVPGKGTVFSLFIPS